MPAVTQARARLFPLLAGSPDGLVLIWGERDENVVAGQNLRLDLTEVLVEQPAVVIEHVAVVRVRVYTEVSHTIIVAWLYLRKAHAGGRYQETLTDHAR